MNRRNFLKSILGAGAALVTGPVLANAKGPGVIGIDMAKPGEDKTVYWGESVISRDDIKRAQNLKNEITLEHLEEMGRVLDAADVPRHKRTVHEIVIDPVTFKRVTRITSIP